MLKVIGVVPEKEQGKSGVFWIVVLSIAEKDWVLFWKLMSDV